MAIDGIDRILEEGYFSPDFKEYMLKEQLKWSREKLGGVGGLKKLGLFWPSDFGWVFWSQQDHEIEPSVSRDNCADFNPNVCAIPKVRDNIRYALQKLLSSSTFCLVQFWAPTTTLEGTLLTTQYQPFAFGPTYKAERQQLCEYRMKMCTEYKFYADAESGEEQLGLPGRVFLHKSPESSPHVKFYSTKEYPQRDLALRCQIDKSWAVPVFERSSQTCVGVLEIVSLSCMSLYWHGEFLACLYDTFQEFGLLCFDSYKHCEMQVGDDNIKAQTTAFQELDMVLSVVCKIHKLPLAMTWVPCSACKGLLRCQLGSKYAEFCDHSHFGSSEFLRVSKLSHLRKGEVVGRVRSPPYMLYCSDITQISLAKYPLVSCARRCNFGGWFAICLQSRYTVNAVYVLEFFLPASSKDDKNILNTLSLILGTMEECFVTFKHASGQKLHFVQMIQAPRLSPCPELLKDRELMLLLGQLDQPSTDAIHGGMNVVSEERNYILPSLEALQNGEAMMQQDSPHQPPLDPSNNGQNVVFAKRNMIMVTSLEEGTRKTQEREHKKAGVRIEISLEDILKCSQLSQKNAAGELKVSIYTLKRVCREYGIFRWPPRKINMVYSSRPLSVEDQNQSPEMNFDTASDQASACVANINLGFQDADMAFDQASACVAKRNLGLQDADMVTIKAKYAGYTIKFRLSSSPTLVELQQEVGKRLNLEAETYYVQYEDEETELILIGCDEDLQACVRTSISLGRTFTMVLLKPK